MKSQFVGQVLHFAACNQCICCNSRHVGISENKWSTFIHDHLKIFTCRKVEFIRKQSGIKAYRHKLLLAREQNKGKHPELMYNIGLNL